MVKGRREWRGEKQGGKDWETGVRDWRTMKFKVKDKMDEDRNLQVQ